MTKTTPGAAGEPAEPHPDLWRAYVDVGKPHCPSRPTSAPRTGRRTGKKWLRKNTTNAMENSVHPMIRPFWQEALEEAVVHTTQQNLPMQRTKPARQPNKAPKRTVAKGRRRYVCNLSQVGCVEPLGITSLQIGHAGSLRDLPSGPAIAPCTTSPLGKYSRRSLGVISMQTVPYQTQR